MGIKLPCIRLFFILEKFGTNEEIVSKTLIINYQYTPESRSCKNLFLAVVRNITRQILHPSLGLRYCTFKSFQKYKILSSM